VNLCAPCVKRFAFESKKTAKYNLKSINTEGHREFIEDSRRKTRPLSNVWSMARTGEK
jgi:hypothetical protein